MEQLELFEKAPDPDQSTVVSDVIMIETKYYQFLLGKTEKCLRLEQAGVDSWEGYAQAMQQVTSAQEGDDV